MDHTFTFSDSRSLMNDQAVLQNGYHDIFVANEAQQLLQRTGWSYYTIWKKIDHPIAGVSWSGGDVNRSSISRFGDCNIGLSLQRLYQQCSFLPLELGIVGRAALTRQLQWASGTELAEQINALTCYYCDLYSVTQLKNHGFQTILYIPSQNGVVLEIGTTELVSRDNAHGVLQDLLATIGLHMQRIEERMSQLTSNTTSGPISSNFNQVAYDKWAPYAGQPSLSSVPLSFSSSSISSPASTEQISTSSATFSLSRNPADPSSLFEGNEEILLASTTCTAPSLGTTLPFNQLNILSQTTDLDAVESLSDFGSTWGVGFGSIDDPPPSLSNCSEQYIPHSHSAIFDSNVASRYEGAYAASASTRLFSLPGNPRKHSLDEEQQQWSMQTGAFKPWTSKPKVLHPNKPENQLRVNLYNLKHILTTHIDWMKRRMNTQVTDAHPTTQKFLATTMDHTGDQSEATVSIKHHMLAERNRRRKQKDCFAHLRSLVPNITKRDKVTALERTIEYVKEMQRRLLDLEQRNRLSQNSTVTELQSITTGVSQTLHKSRTTTKLAATSKLKFKYATCELDRSSQDDQNFPCFELKACVENEESQTNATIISVMMALEQQKLQCIDLKIKFAQKSNNSVAKILAKYKGAENHTVGLAEFQAMKQWWESHVHNEESTSARDQECLATLDKH